MVSDERIKELRDYITQGDRRAEEPSVSLSGALIRRVLGADLRLVLRQLVTDAQRPLMRRKIAHAQLHSPLRLHLGCGHLYKEGWVNVDLAGARVDIAWNLARGVPFRGGSVDAIFHEHVLEVLTLEAGYELTRECLRVLKPGGILRIGTTHAGECLRSYAGQADPGWANSRPTALLAVHGVFYEWSRRAVYDAETLTLMCRAAGFEEAIECHWGEGRLTPNPDSASRRDGTLYVEAVKA